MTRIHQPIFPHLNPDIIGDIIETGVEIHQKEVKAFSSSTTDAIHSLKKLVPMRPSSSVLPDGDTRLTKYVIFAYFSLYSRFKQGLYIYYVCFIPFASTFKVKLLGI